MLVACSGPACPTGTHADAPRTARILAQLDAWGQPRPSGSLCWVDQPPSGVLPDGRLRLERDLGDVAAAARAAHLTRHVGQAPLEADAPCEPQVASWIAAEGRAWALEVALRQRAGLPAELPFEVQARAAADPAATIEAWLWAHPDGSDGIDGIVAGYRARCR